MRVVPITEAEASMSPGMWQRGLYEFEVIKAEEKRSAKGNEMIKLMVKVYDGAGKSRIVFDYLVSTEGMAYKVRHFASATNLIAQYDKGELRAEECQGRGGRCQVGVQQAKDGYPAKNTISDYIPAGALPHIPGVPIEMEDLDDDDEIPF